VRSFGELFPGYAPRPLQEAAEATARDWDGPALVLVEAPMGEGKTEAAQVIADACDRRGGQGCYFALPTMATSNGMYDRVVAFLRLKFLLLLKQVNHIIGGGGVTWGATKMHRDIHFRAALETAMNIEGVLHGRVPSREEVESVARLMERSGLVVEDYDVLLKEMCQLVGTIRPPE
jgi:hypothetical protein